MNEVAYIDLYVRSGIILKGSAVSYQIKKGSHSAVQ